MNSDSPDFEAVADILGNYDVTARWWAPKLVWSD